MGEVPAQGISEGRAFIRLPAVPGAPLPNLRFLDVWDIPADLGPPTTASGALRKSQRHYLDLDVTRSIVTIHSDPVPVPVLTEGLVRELIAESPPDQQLAPVPAVGTRSSGRDTRVITDVREFLEGGRNRVAAFMPDV
jgi:hypothetical protein